MSFNAEQPRDRYLEYPRKLTQLVIGDESRADLDSGDAVALDDDPRHLKLCREIALRQAMSAPRLVYTITANILLSVVIVYLHNSPPKSTKFAKVQNLS